MLFSTLFHKEHSQEHSQEYSQEPSQNILQGSLNLRNCFLLAVILVCFMGGELALKPTADLLAQPHRSIPDRGINEDDLRVAEVRALLIDGKAIPSDGLRLRYAGKRGDYLEFYDLEGGSIYYRYRRDRFDLSAEKKIESLIQGQAYQVVGNFQGLLYQGIFFSKEFSREGQGRQATGKRERFSELLANKNAYLVFSYLSANPLLVEQLLL